MVDYHRFKVIGGNIINNKKKRGNHLPLLLNS
nr:MAG TPA: hypothetical protein [Caudoviricetes sp.]